jgi:hypothetical protein
MTNYSSADLGIKKLTFMTTVTGKDLIAQKLFPTPE